MNELFQLITENKLPWAVLYSIVDSDNTDMLVKEKMVHFFFQNYTKGNGSRGKWGAINRSINTEKDQYFTFMNADNSISFAKVLCDMSELSMNHVDMFSSLGFKIFWGTLPKTPIICT